MLPCRCGRRLRRGAPGRRRCTKPARSPPPGSTPQPVRPGALQAEEVGEADRRDPPEYQDGPEDPGNALFRRDKSCPPGISKALDLVESFRVELFFDL